MKGLKNTSVMTSVLAISLFSSAVFPQETGEKETDEPKFTVIEPTDEIARRAKQAADGVRSKGIVELTGQMGQRIRRALGAVESGAKGETDIVEPPHNAFRAILFASQSMPLQTLRRYAAQLEKVNGVIVFRGVPGGLSKLKPLVKFTSDLIKKDPKCDHADCPVYNVGVLLDPLIFRNNNVQQVPAVTIVETDPFAAYCERPEEDSASARGVQITFGDAHLTGHLEALSSLGDKRADIMLDVFLSQGEN